MNPTLRIALAFLVLTCMAFVQITGVIGWHWLAAFYALTLAAPWLSRFNERRLSRMLWNGGVLLIFAILVNDATKTTVRYMLEDGLILAAFCQVHLLNNLGRKQSPDLLFFNSFLIALVTCFFSDDVAFLLVFLPWVPLQLGSMLLATLARDERDLAPSTWRAVVWTTLRRSCVTLALTAGAFVLIPRDFAREGLAGRLLDIRGTNAEVGFSDEIQLGWRSASRREHPVLRVTRATPNAPWPTYWRGATMTTLTGSTWFSSSADRILSGRLPHASTWRRTGVGSWTRQPERRSENSFDVEILDEKARRLFLPHDAAHFEVGPYVVAENVNARNDATVSYDHRAATTGRTRSSVRYRVTTGPRRSGANEPAGRIRNARQKRELRPFLSVPNNSTSLRAAQLARQLLGGSMRAREQHAIVERLRAQLAQNQGYALPGEEGAAEGLEDFLSGAKGHCEYFATALALMLRTQSIPCRIASGFRSNADPTATEIVVSSMQAHAWVECWDPSAGWYIVDATPPIADEVADAAPGWFADARRFLDDAWKNITTMDAAGRIRAIAWLQDSPAMLLRTVKSNPISVAFAILGLVALVALRRRRRRVPHAPEIVDYERAVRACGLERAHAETPHELLGRAESLLSSQQDAEKLEDLRRATDAHERARYAGNTGS